MLSDFQHGAPGNFWATYVKAFRKLLFWSTFLLLGFALSHDMCLWSAPQILHFPSILLQSVGDLTIFAFLAAFRLSMYFAVHAFLERSDRPAAISYLGRTVTCVFFAILFPAVLQWTSVQRTAAFARASVNGAPIIAALKEYRSDNGKYPNSLKILVPAYVSALPPTGLIGYPEFTYRNGANDSSAVSDSYELRINCPSGTINFDRFIYWPAEEYPERIQGTEPN